MDARGADGAPATTAPDPDPSRVRRAATAYALSAVVGRASGLAVVPLLFVLPLDAVGAWSIAMAVRALAATVGSASLDSYVTQTYYATPPAERTALVRGCIARCARWNALLAVALAPLMALPAARMAVAMAWSGQAVAVVNTALAGARIREAPRAYLALSVPPGLASIALCVSLVLVAHAGVWGLVAGVTAPWVIAAAAAAIATLRAPPPAGHAAYLRRVHPGRMLGDCFGQADRLLLGALVPKASLGVYELATRLASPAALVWSSAKAALMADALRRLAAEPRARLARPFIASWCSGTAVAAGVLAGVAVTAIVRGRGDWAAALPLAWGAVAVQAWLFTQSFFGALVYHRRLVGAQAWLPIAAIVVTVAGGAIGTWAGGVPGAMAGFVVAQAANTGLTAWLVARAWPDRPRAGALVALTAALTALAAVASLTPSAVTAAFAAVTAAAAAAGAVAAWKAPRPDAHPRDG